LPSSIYLEEAGVSSAIRLIGIRYARVNSVPTQILHWQKSPPAKSLAVETAVEGQSLTAEDQLFILKQAGL
jgi:hypothetical protein